MIPVGTRRLPVSWLKKADIVWVNHGPLPPALQEQLRPDALVVEARYRPKGWVRRGQPATLGTRPVVALAGIARPEGFFRLVRNLGIEAVKTWSYPDHHRFAWTELQSIEAWLDDHHVVMTEKDAARLPRDIGIHYLELSIEVTSGASALETRLQTLC